jgi:hypothetical protein
MAAATAVISAGVALAGVGLSINQAVQADKERKQAQKAATAAANRMKNIKEENAFKDIEMPTLGFELAQQSADRQMMTGIQTAQGAGAEQGRGRDRRHPGQDRQHAGPGAAAQEVAGGGERPHREDARRGPLRGR